jgi:EmrB/QacA subfamily drug resistance transporter
LTSIDVERYITQVNASPEMSTYFRKYGINYRWYAMMAIISANIAAVLASTIINVAIPDIMGAFGIGQDQAQWLGTSFLAAATIAMLCSAWMVSAIGLRATVLLSMSIFLLGSVVGGLATNLETMILSRILQGLPAGLLTPLTMTVIFQVFPRGKQGLAMGVSAIGVILAPAIGPTLGGLAVDALSWRYVFFMGIPISAVSLLLAWLILPSGSVNARKPFDWPGLILLTVALVSLLVVLSNGAREGWSSNFILSYLAIFTVCGPGFIIWQYKQVHPLLDLELFRQRNFSIMCIVAFVFGAGLYASTYVIPLFLQLVQRLSPTDSGVMLMPAGFIMVLAFPLSGRLSDRYDARLIIAVGILFFAYAFWLMSGADAGTSFWTFAVWVILSRIGIGLVMPALQMGALKGIELARINAASGSFSFIRQLGGAFGVNLSSIFLERRTELHRATFIESQTYANSDTLEVLQGLSYYSTQLGYVGTDSWNAARGLLAQMIHSQALVAGFKDSFLLLTVVFLAVLIPTLMLERSNRA